MSRTPMDWAAMPSKAGIRWGLRQAQARDAPLVPQYPVDDALAFLVQAVTATEKPAWPLENKDFGQFLRRGLYSPIQILAGMAAQRTDAESKQEFPFPSSFGALFLAWIYHGQNQLQPALPELSTDVVRRFRRAMQEVFFVRERHEERQRLSIEVVLEHGVQAPMGGGRRLDELGRYFGRGVATVWLVPHGSDDEAIFADVKKIFPTHEKAPASILYKLDAPFGSLSSNSLSVCLRRDGLVTIASEGNPLLEYYNARWHVVDLKSAQEALDIILGARFGSSPKGFATKLIRLAYHLATHWHSAIIAVATEADIEHLFEAQTEEDMVARLINRQFSAGGDPIMDSSAAISDGFGRSLLSSSIQDGSLVFTPTGRLHSSSRMIKGRLKPLTGRGGSGTRAAAAIGKVGVAIKVSKDGQIRIFARDATGRLLVPSEGLFVH